MQRDYEHNFFSGLLNQKGLDRFNRALAGDIEKVSADEVESAVACADGRFDFNRLCALVSPAGADYLEEMAQKAMRITHQRFGKCVQLYAPLYVSNYCVNSCLYCAFNSAGESERIRLSIDQAVAEADIIADDGFRHILLVSGEDRGAVDVDYLAELAGRLRKKFSSISIEVYPLSKSDYEKLFASGVDGIAIYQETYDRDDYAFFHSAGPKSDFDWRVGTLERAGAAGLRSLGLGFLIGLSDWRLEAAAMALHADFLMKKYWKSRVSFSFPRLRPAENVDEKVFRHMMTDSQLAQLMLALRLCFADAEIVLSTRENQTFRDNMTRICVTRISAGSRTNPGGYSDKDTNLKQFEIADDRCPAEIARMLKSKGLEAVWKDFDSAFTK